MHRIKEKGKQLIFKKKKVTQSIKVLFEYFEYFRIGYGFSIKMTFIVAYANSI